MNANDVYNVAKALSQDEFNKLLKMLKSEVSTKPNIKKNKKPPIITDEEASKYILKTVFGIKDD